MIIMNDLPYSIVASPAARVEEELTAFAFGPELLGELDEDLGVDGHVELIDRHNLPWLMYTFSVHETEVQNNACS